MDQGWSGFFCNGRGRGQMFQFPSEMRAVVQVQEPTMMPQSQNQGESSTPTINYGQLLAVGRGAGRGHFLPLAPFPISLNLPKVPKPPMPAPLDPPKPNLQVEVDSNAPKDHQSSNQITVKPRHWKKDCEDLRIAVVKNETFKDLEAKRYRRLVSPCGGTDFYYDDPDNEWGQTPPRRQGPFRRYWR